MNESLPTVEQTISDIYVPNATITCKRGDIVDLAPVIYGLLSADTDIFSDGNITVDNNVYQKLKGIPLLFASISTFKTYYPMLTTGDFFVKPYIDKKYRLHMPKDKRYYNKYMFNGSVSDTGKQDISKREFITSLTYLIRLIFDNHNPSDTKKYRNISTQSGTRLIYEYPLNYNIKVAVTL